MINNIDFYIVGSQDSSPKNIINKAKLLIMLRHSDRMWLEPMYYDATVRAESKVNVIIPKGPNDPNLLLDALIGFSPALFSMCDGYEEIVDFLSKTSRLDFDVNSAEILSTWASFRERAKLKSEDLNIWQSTKV